MNQNYILLFQAIVLFCLLVSHILERQETQELAMIKSQEHDETMREYKEFHNLKKREAAVMGLMHLICPLQIDKDFIAVCEKHKIDIDWSLVK